MLKYGKKFHGEKVLYELVKFDETSGRCKHVSGW